MSGDVSWRRRISTAMAYCGVGAVACVLSVESRGDDSLLHKTKHEAPRDSGAIRCCPPGALGESGGNERCLERLTRFEEPEDSAAACSAVLGLPGQGALFSKLSGDRGNCGTSPELLAITTDQMVERWWQRDPPRLSPVPSVYRRSEGAAVYSQQCRQELADLFGSTQKADETLKRCEGTGFIGVHAYFAGSADLEPAVATMKARDRWTTHLSPDESSPYYPLRSMADLKSAATDLLSKCHVIDYAFVNAHGRPGKVTLFDGLEVSIGDFLSQDFVSPCLLSPKAKVQFSGCDLACNPAGPIVEAMLNLRLTDPKYSSGGQPAPFRETKFLFNTDLGYAETAAGPGNIHVHSRNDISVEMVFREGGYVPDLSWDTAPGCQSTLPEGERGHEFSDPREWASKEPEFRAFSRRLPSGRVSGSAGPASGALSRAPVPADAPRASQEEERALSACRDKINSYIPGFARDEIDPLMSIPCCQLFCARHPESQLCTKDRDGLVCKGEFKRLIDRLKGRVRKGQGRKGRQTS